MDIKSLLIQAIGHGNFKEYDKYFMIRCISPDHEDHKPSMHVSKKTGVYYCMGCGYKGGIDKFVKHFPHITLNVDDMKFFMNLSAAHEEARGVGALGELEPDWESITMKVEGDVRSVFAIPEALEYLRSRGVTDEFIEYHEVKAAENAYVNGTRFTNRIMIPIFYNGRLVNIEGRDYTRQQQPKVLYPKGCTTNVLFNWKRIVPGQPLHIVEGLMDIVPLFPVTKNVTPLFGSSLKRFQAKLLHDFISHPGSQIILWPDHDRAGEEIMKQFEKEELPYSIAPYPLERKDPGECTQSEIECAVKNPVSSANMLMAKYGVFVAFDGFEWSTDGSSEC